MYVIVRHKANGKLEYVTPPGSDHSYTDRLEEARVFDTKDKARSEICPDNESVRSIESLLQRSH